MNIKEIYKCQNQLMEVLKAKKSDSEELFIINYKNNSESIKSTYF